MIAGLCESPLTFQAVTIWRKELNDGNVFLHDIIDLEATYAGPDAKAVPAAVPGGDAPSTAPASAPPFLWVVPPQPVAPPSAPPAPTPFKPKPLNVGDSEEQPEEGTLRESDPDEDDPENSMSLAAIEAELKPKVLEIFDAIADTFKRLRRLQDHPCGTVPARQVSSPTTKPRVQHVKGAARRCYDYILFGWAAARQEPGPERRPHRPNVLSIASEVVASVVTA